MSTRPSQTAPHGTATVTRALSLAVALACTLSFALATPPAAAGTQESAANPPRLFDRDYPLEHLDYRFAESLVQQICAGHPAERCRVANSSPRFLSVVADAAIHAEIAGLLAERDVVHTQSFQVVLVSAERAGKGIDDAIPANTRQALVDLQQFLPYTRFQLVDMAWLRTSRDAEANLAGPNGQLYSVELRFHPALDPSSGELLVDGFRLRTSSLPSQPALPAPPTEVPPAPRAPAEKQESA